MYNIDQVIEKSGTDIVDNLDTIYHKVYCTAERAGLPARAIARQAAQKLGFTEQKIQALEAWY